MEKMTEERLWRVYNTFYRRLKKLGIEIECGSNVPWIYLESVNGKEVTERLWGEHGFTAFWFPVAKGNIVEFSDRRKVFKKVREMINA